MEIEKMTMSLQDKYAQHVHVKVQFDQLHHRCQGLFLSLAFAMVKAYDEGRTGNLLFLPFEGYRNPLNQILLVRNKRSKAGPWQSAHNYGMAVDFVPVRLPQGDFRPKDARGLMWTWDGNDIPWDVLDAEAEKLGLSRPIEWDRPHIQHPLWNLIKDVVV